MRVSSSFQTFVFKPSHSLAPFDASINILKEVGFLVDLVMVQSRAKAQKDFLASLLHGNYLEYPLSPLPCRSFLLFLLNYLRIDILYHFVTLRNTQSSFSKSDIPLVCYDPSHHVATDSAAPAKPLLRSLGSLKSCRFRESSPEPRAEQRKANHWPQAADCCLGRGFRLRKTWIPIH